MTSKRRQARVVKQESTSKSRQARVVKQETASKSRQARDGKQESSSKSQQARVDKKETDGKQETAIDEKAENTVKECTNWKDKKKDKEQEALLISEDTAFKCARGAGKNKRVWSAEEDAKLIDALLELHASGKYSSADNGFKPGYDKAVQALLDVSLPNGFKRQDLLSGMSGFGWDPEKCVLNAPHDVWADYIKEKKHAAPFKDKALPYYEKLCTVFGKNRATGARAEDLGDDEIVQETPPVSPIDVDMDVPISSGIMLLVNNESILANLVLVDCAKSYKDQEAVKECYKEYIGMVKIYYEEAKRSRHGEPGDVAVNCRGTAGKERPQADARIDAEVEEC
ncbi:hypothetical protein Tco_0240850 [Tanacetum coccineum]